MRQVFEYDPDIGYRFIPGLKARIPHESGGYLIRANSTGFRSDHEFGRTRTPGSRRVLLFGDSYTAGDGVSNGKRYSDVLERELPNVEVFNFGLPGTGTDQQYLAYRKYGRDIEHDLLVIVVMVENIRRIVAHYRHYSDEQGRMVCYAKPYFELGGGGALSLRHVPPRKDPVSDEDLPPEERGTVDRVGRFPKLRQWLIRTNLERLAHKVTRFQPYPEYGSPEHPAWQLMSTILREWIGSHPGPTLLVPLPLYYFVEELSSAKYAPRFKKVAEQTGCAWFDPLPELLKYDMAERRKFRFKKDVHPTPAGHVALARALAPAIQKALEGKL